jgi:hypothetical protein
VLVYREEAFRYFLAVERARTERSGRPFLIVLVKFRRPEGGRLSIPARTAAKMFVEMSLCIRESDFIGWLRDDTVAAAVLVQPSNEQGGELRLSAANRLIARVHDYVPASIANHMSTRVLKVRPTVAVSR